VRAWPTLVLVVAAYAAAAVTVVRTQEHKSAWDAAFTMEQANSGQALYAKTCAHCHGPDLTGEGFAPPLIGEAFSLRWADASAHDLFTVIQQSMPQEAPGSLSTTETVDLIAFLLQKNGASAGQQPLPADVSGLRALALKKISSGNKQ
jgi:mono/diheme cytochrome c family protein